MRKDVISGIVLFCLVGISGNVWAESQSNDNSGTVSTISLVTDSSWKSLDAEVEGWKSVNFDDSWWEDAEEEPEVLRKTSWSEDSIKNLIGEGGRAIWYPGLKPHTAYFRKSFEIDGTEVISGRIYVVVYAKRNTNNFVRVYVNDNNIGSKKGGSRGKEIIEFDIAPYLNPGKNVIAVKAEFENLPNAWSNWWGLIGKIRYATTSPTPNRTRTSSRISAPATTPATSPSVYLYGEKTDVEVGEDISLSFSAVNLITSQDMTVQLILKVPSGMSVTSTGFTDSGAGQYTRSVQIGPGGQKQMSINIKTNQVGNFNVGGEIYYYYQENEFSPERIPVELPVVVRAKQQVLPNEQGPSEPATDSDGDGLTDVQEKTLKTNPYNADTDGDGIIDSEDANPLISKKPKGDKGGICGPTALLGIALLPLGLWGLLRRRR